MIKIGESYIFMTTIGTFSGVVEDFRVTTVGILAQVDLKDGKTLNAANIVWWRKNAAEK